MGAKTGTGSKGSPNDTGKSGNDSGNDVKEARGPSYEHQQGVVPSDKNEEHQGKHPPNKIYTGPKDMHRTLNEALATASRTRGKPGQSTPHGNARRLRAVAPAIRLPCRLKPIGDVEGDADMPGIFALRSEPGRRTGFYPAPFPNLFF